ncbi:hypothetical protein IGI37_003187 [Enterococcus sp. AZ194]|uniref:hypothetical protein n=1 Tax=Enterococcus sp. AZ194 TaxID=2774629 RepID=UPI003F243CAC
MDHKFEVIDNVKDITFLDIESTGGLRIGDGLIQYMLDSFQWLTTYWNKLGNESNGLNYHGVTFITIPSEILQMKNIISAWRSLFEFAPNNFIVHTEYDLEEQEFIETNLKQSLVINELGNLIILCEKALEEEKILVHFGI